MLRKSRFHDETGNAVKIDQWKGICRSLISTIARKAFNVRPVLPWLPYELIDRLDSLVSGESRVLEYGSGMSTVWWASRVGSVVSIESDESWYAAVKAKLQRRHIELEGYFLRTEVDYPSLREIRGHFDVVVIDGLCRDRCAAVSLSRVRDGGWIVLDDTDKFCGNPDAHIPRAESKILDEVHVRNGTAEYFTGFKPTSFFAGQSLLSQL